MIPCSHRNNTIYRKIDRHATCVENLCLMEGPLKRHKLNHIKVRLHMCDVFGMSFLQAKGLKRNKRIHTVSFGLNCDSGFRKNTKCDDMTSTSNFLVPFCPPDLKFFVRTFFVLFFPCWLTF